LSTDTSPYAQQNTGAPIDIGQFVMGKMIKMDEVPPQTPILNFNRWRLKGVRWFIMCVLKLGGT
jgi:hypothetical protein